MSDVHLEFGPLIMPGDPEAILILAGDITTVRKTKEEFFQQCVDKYKHVIYIMGNHEYYGGDWDTAKELIQMTLPKEIHFLENESVVLDGVLFIGATLWTDMNNADPLTIYECGNKMNDYHLVSKDGCKLTPEATLEAHYAAKEFITGALTFANGHKTVVITHHMPSYSCVHQRYKDENLLNGAYRSDLEDIIYKYEPDLWVFGHSHHSHHSYVHNTRLYSNPRGYVVVEENDEFDPNAWLMV